VKKWLHDEFFQKSSGIFLLFTFYLSAQ